jgi:hypothetical protein
MGKIVWRSFIICTLYLILLGWLNLGGWDMWGMQHTWGNEKHVLNFGQKVLKGKDHVWDLDIDGRTVLRYILVIVSEGVD